MKKNSNEFSWQGMLIVSVLGIIGLLILFMSGCFNITTGEELFDYIYDYGFLVIFCLFFLGVSIYCWILYFRNIILKPKKDILYSLKIEDDVVSLIDRKGKIYLFSNIGISVGKFYYVFKTKDTVLEILCESTDTFILPKVKKSYWLNFYSPIGSFEDMFLLPILYVIFIPGLLSIIMSSGFQKIYGIIYSLFPGYVIIYDFIYKIKLNNSGEFGIDDSKMINSYLIFINSLKVLFVIILNIILINVYMNTSDTLGKFILLPICFFGVWSFGYVISKIIDNDKFVNFFIIGYVVIFLLFWFGFLIFVIMQMIKEKNEDMILFTIPFWVVGLYIFYKKFIKKR